MSGPIHCCGVRWTTSIYSDAIYLGAPETRASLDGRCGVCRKALASPMVVTLCGEALCMATATHRAFVKPAGPLLFFCKEHADKLARAAADAGVASKIELLEGGSLP